MKPVYDEIRFLHFLCRAANKGKFVPNLGIKVRDERIEREKARLRYLKQQERKPGGSETRCENRSQSLRSTTAGRDYASHSHAGTGTVDDESG